MAVENRSRKPKYEKEAGDESWRWKLKMKMTVEEEAEDERWKLKKEI